MLLCNCFWIKAGNEAVMALQRGCSYWWLQYWGHHFTDIEVPEAKLSFLWTNQMYNTASDQLNQQLAIAQC